jgi:hypothetical protein
MTDGSIVLNVRIEAVVGREGIASTACADTQ